MWPFVPHVPVKPKTLLERLDLALLDNHRIGTSILMDPHDTSFIRGQTLDERDAEAECINAIRAIPCHYAETPP